jgi:ATP-dependent helicase/nuclease subunit B
MSLQLILGSAGSGKSHKLYKDVISESLERQEDNFIVIVPEQFTLGTQKKIVDMHPKNGVLNIDIVSFQRLAYKVFEELGVDEGEVLDDTGKSLIIRKILEDKKDELAVFKKNIDKPGFVEEVKSAVSELLQYGVEPEKIQRVIEDKSDNPLFQAKMQDLLNVYTGFKNYINGRYIANEEILEVLCRVAADSQIIRNSTITLDGFTGFTPIQYRLIGILLEVCRKVSITLTIDSREKINVNDGITNLFYLSKDTASKLMRIADERHVPVERHICMEDAAPYRLKDSESLIFLEKNIFRYHSGTFNRSDESIQIFEASNSKGEAIFAAGEIKRLVMEKGYHYRDFAIVSADIENYGELCANILSHNDIPSFLDYKKNILENAAVLYIRNVLKIIEDNFSYEAVFGYLKTNFSDISIEQADILENYCLAMGIRGIKRYEDRWIRKTRRMEEEELSLEYINSIREKLIGEIKPLYEEMRKCKTVRQYTTALYNFMVSSNLEQKLYEKSVEFAQSYDMARKSEYEQVFGKLIALLDKLVALLGEEDVSLGEFCDILDAGFREIKVGLIPQASDAVMIGDIERTRLENIKILFFVGVNDGIIPKQASSGGIISENDKEILRDSQVELSMTERDKVFIQKFYLYLSMTKPSDRLYLSYARICSDGKARKMSYLLLTIQKLFPDIITRNSENEEYTAGLVKIPKALFRWEFVDEQLDAATSRALYGDDYMTSISAIEKYSACAFAHFVTFGLRLNERETYDVKASDIGTLVHNTLERYAQKLRENNQSFLDVDDEQRSRYIKESVSEITTDYGNTILYSSKRREYLIKRLEIMTDRTVWAINKQLSFGEFVPEEFEKTFYLNNRVRGRIDRIDTCEDDQNVYIKVVDYKTGESDFDLLETYYGLKIQLVTYMNAAAAIEKKKHPDKNIVPAGMFYYNIKNPFAQDVQTESEIDEQILAQLRVKGVVNGDARVIKKLDNASSSSSLAIPVSYNKDGSVRSSGNVLSREQLEIVSEYVDKLIDTSVQEVLDGKMDAQPVLNNGRTACEYCSFKAVCGFDEKLPDCKYRNLKKLSDEQIFEELRRNVDGTKVD